MTTPEVHQSERIREITELAGGNDIEAIRGALHALPLEEQVRVLARVEPDVLQHVLLALEPDHAADIVHALPEAQAVEVLDDLPSESAAEIIDELPSSERADLVGEMAPEAADAVLAALPAAEAEDIRRLAEYEDDEAGGVMDSEFVAFRVHETVGDVIQNMRDGAEELRDYTVLYIYVTDDQDRLVGVLRLRDLLLADWRTPVEKIMIAEPFSVAANASLRHLEEVFTNHSYLGVPVVDGFQRLVGVVRRSAVDEALSERNVDEYLKSQGIVREELRTMAVTTRSRRRLGWLSINILLNVIAASVIAFYQETLSQVIALAVFLPIISDMSGCSGNQAVAVSMRELSLGLIDGRDVWRVWRAEVSVGLANGAVLGLLIAAVAWLWQGSPWLGLVVGGALMLNTVIAVTLGGTLPVFLRRLGVDPALASGPVLTTVTDMCGFFLVLSMAAAMLGRLT